ncbi:cofactor-independent phosphoglycerate mutase [Candidatus Omnitrophota bacterium]
MKYIIIVPDGMADYPLVELDNRTPLEAALTTNMDYCAANGIVGQLQTIPAGMKPGSDVGNMSLLGYNPEQYLTGRAPLEAANLDITLAEDEIAFRCNFVTIFDDQMSDYSAGHISSRESHLLIDTLNQELKSDTVRFHPGKSYRHLMIIKSRHPEVYAQIATTPPHDILGEKIADHLPKGRESEMILKLMEQSKDVLMTHSVNTVRLDLGENPANMIWLWGQGQKPQLPTFKDKYGLNGAIISAVDLVNGIGKLIGLQVVDVPGITGYYDTNYLGKATYALDALKENDFVFIHIEAPDEASHNGDFQAKMDALERIDRDIVGTVLNHFDRHDDVRILVLPDHATPTHLRTHTSDPVGFVMIGKGIRSDAAKIFTETEASHSSLKFAGGEELMQYFINKGK